MKGEVWDGDDDDDDRLKPTAVVPDDEKVIEKYWRIVLAVSRRLQRSTALTTPRCDH